MKRLLGFIIIAAFLLSPRVWAEEAKLYRYIDDQGVTRFTDSMEAIPEEYHSTVEQTDAVVSDPSTEATPEPKPAPKTTQAPKLSKEDRVKLQEKAEYEELEKYEQELTQQLVQLEEDLSRAARRKSKSGKDKNAWKQLRQQKRDMEEEIERTQNRMLEIEP